MATLGTVYPTFTDIQKSLDPNGRPARLVNLLSQSNPILDDMQWMPTNDNTTHLISVVTSIPVAQERSFNEGVVPQKETLAQFREDTAIVEQWSEVDRVLVETATDPAGYRFEKSLIFLEGLNQKMSTLALYGNNTTNAKQINGFLTRLNSLSGANAQNIIDAGGTGSDNASILGVVWGPGKCMGIFPRNTTAGLLHEDKGIQTRTDFDGVNNAILDVYRDVWRWHFGISIEDWRYAFRIANIDVSNMKALSSAADLTDLMMQAEGLIPNLDANRITWYMPRAIYTHFGRQRRNDVSTGGQLSYEVVDGRRIPFFNMNPIRPLDSLTLTEAQVT